ncbi:MAG: TonB-dependent receptor [Sideroxydans sp.]|nr:TonB-dependent receptor [Sideroxydans sp.]
MALFASGAQAEEPQTLQEVTVTGKRDDVTERREATTQKVVLERKDIESMGVTTIGEVMGKLPGVEISVGGGHRARGMTRDSVLILIDGERSAGGSMGVASMLGRLPSGDLERVEILRGSSAEFGGAASVTVNMVMKKALPKSSTEGRLGLGKRGTETGGQLALTQTGGEGGFAWSLPVSLMWNNSPVNSALDRLDSTASPQTSAERTGGKFKMGHHSITPRLTWKDGSDSLTVSPLLFYSPQDTNTTTELSAGGAASGSRVSSTSNLSRTVRLRVEGEKHVADTKFTARTALNSSKRNTDVTRSTYSAGNVLTGTTSDQNESREKEFNMALRVDKPMGGEHLLAVGVEHISMRRDQDQNFSGSAATYQVQEKQYIAWVQDDWMVREKTTLTYGLRGESIKLDASSSSLQRGQLMPSLAVRWEPQDKWVVRSSLGAGLKMPKLDEISDAATLGITNSPLDADKRGNPNLQPERSVNFEAVLERYLDGDSGLIGSNLYVRSTRDFTERRVQLETTRWVDRPYNEGRALHWGLELDGKLRTDSYGWKGATVKAHLTLPRARVNDTRLGITRDARDTPRYVLSAGLEGNLPKLQSSYGVSLQQSGRSVTEIPGEESAATQAKTTLDAFWLYRLTAQYKLRLSAQNLLAADTVRDLRFTQGGNVWQSHTVEGGYRTVMATLEGRW